MTSCLICCVDNCCYDDGDYGVFNDDQAVALPVDGLRPCDPLDGEYETYSQNCNPSIRMETFAFTKRGDQCTVWGSQTGRNTYTLTGGTMHLNPQQERVTGVIWQCRQAASSAEIDFTTRTFRWPTIPGDFVSRPLGSELEFGTGYVPPDQREPRVLAPALEGIYDTVRAGQGAGTHAGSTNAVYELSGDPLFQGSFALTVHADRCTIWHDVLQAPFDKRDVTSCRRDYQFVMLADGRRSNLFRNSPIRPAPLRCLVQPDGALYWNGASASRRVPADGFDPATVVAEAHPIAPTQSHSMDRN